MAFEFASRLENRLFYPTVHIHDGTVKKTGILTTRSTLSTKRWTGALRGCPTIPAIRLVGRGQTDLRES